jgi:hypothetical protein
VVTCITSVVLLSEHVHNLFLTLQLAIKSHEPHPYLCYSALIHIVFVNANPDPNPPLIPRLLLLP